MTTFPSELCFPASMNVRFQCCRECHVALELMSIECQALKVHLCCRKRCDCITCDPIPFSPLPIPSSLICSTSFPSSWCVPAPHCSPHSHWKWGGRMTRPNLASVSGFFFFLTLTPALVMFGEGHWVLEPSSLGWCFVLWGSSFLMGFSVHCLLSFCIVRWKTHPWALLLCRNKFF